MNALDLLLRDPNLSPAFRRVFASPTKSFRETEADKADERRLLAEPHTPSAFGPLLFGPMHPDRRAEIRADEHADHLADERRERDGGEA